MKDLDDRTKALIEKFTQELNKALGRRLVSLVLYGSAVRGDFVPGKSDLNFMVVVDDLDFEVLKSTGEHIRKFWKKRISTPLVVDEHYIHRSLDVFPLEFSEMKSAYWVIQGSDPLASLEIDDSDLRLQCEAELKRKLLLLREAYLDAHNDRKRIGFLFKESFKSFMVVLKNLLPLLGEEPQSMEEVITRTEDKLGLELKSFHRLLQMRGKKFKPGKDEAEKLMVDYLAEAKELARAVDRLHLDRAGTEP